MVSVVIPVYNREHTISESIKSVINQTYKDIEILVIDDGSTDATAIEIKKIDDDRIRYVFQENSGACAARNKGISLSKGEYIAFHDSDDFWRADKLERQIEYLKNTNADIVFCQMSENGKATAKTLSEGIVSPIAFLKEGNIIGTPTILGKSKCFKEVNFDPQMPRLQDREIAIRLSEKFKMFFMKKVLVDVNTQANSISMNNSNGVIAMQRIIAKNEKLLLDYPKIKERLYSDLIWYKVKNRQDCSEELRLLIKLNPCMKNISKYVLYKLGFLKKRYAKQGY